MFSPGCLFYSPSLGSLLSKLIELANLDLTEEDTSKLRSLWKLSLVHQASDFKRTNQRFIFYTVLFQPPVGSPIHNIDNKWAFWHWAEKKTMEGWNSTEATDGAGLIGGGLIWCLNVCCECGSQREVLQETLGLSQSHRMFPVTVTVSDKGKTRPHKKHLKIALKWGKLYSLVLTYIKTTS